MRLPKILVLIILSVEQNLADIVALVAHVKSTFGRLDALVNNACQTIRRPPTYYAPQVSTRILGRRTAPFPPFLTPCRVPHGSTQDPEY